MKNVAISLFFPVHRGCNNKTGIYGNNYSSNIRFSGKECHSVPNLTTIGFGAVLYAASIAETFSWTGTATILVMILEYSFWWAMPCGN